MYVVVFGPKLEKKNDRAYNPTKSTVLVCKDSKKIPITRKMRTIAANPRN
jgi:hypothetical protein